MSKITPSAGIKPETKKKVPTIADQFIKAHAEGGGLSQQSIVDHGGKKLVSLSFIDRDMYKQSFEMSAENVLNVINHPLVSIGDKMTAIDGLTALLAVQPELGRAEWKTLLDAVMEYQSIPAKSAPAPAPSEM